MRKIITVIMVVLLAIVFVYFGISNLTALFSYTPPLLSIISIALGVFMIIVTIKTSHDN